MRSILVLATVCGAALAAATGGLAGQPVTQPLNPPPPPWQTCKAVGDGTICEGTNVESDGPYDTGIVCANGANAFDIFDSGTDDYSVWKKFDTDGNLVRRVFHDHYTFGQFSNPLIGAVVPYTQTDTQRRDGVPRRQARLLAAFRRRRRVRPRPALRRPQRLR